MRNLGELVNQKALAPAGRLRGDKSRGSAKRNGVGPKWSRVARGNIFSVLVAVASLAPKTPDTDGGPGSQITIAQIAGITRLPRERIVESLEFLRTWRVLWVRFRGETVEVKFQRSVVMWLLGAARAAPKEIGKLIAAHRLRREAIAPLPGAANSAGKRIL